MGYRSNILIVVTDYKPALLAFTLKHPKEAGRINESFKDDIEMNDDLWRLHGESWKWYDNYPDIIAMEAFWSFLDDYQEDYKHTAKFIRIGEGDGDTSDIEQREIGDEAYELGEVSITIESAYINLEE